MQKKNSGNKKLKLNDNKTGWLKNHPVFRFISVFILLMIVFYLFWFSEWYSLHVAQRLASVNATLSSWLLNIFGNSTVAYDTSITSNVFSINIAKGCDGVEAMAVFSAALLAFPLSKAQKFKGLLAGISILFVLNILRIISLYVVGYKYASVFETAHAELWPALFILFAASMWTFIIYYSGKKPSMVE